MLGRRDLVVFVIGGVQSFIAESRSTSDLRAASQIMSDLSRAAADVLGDGDRDRELVMPSGGDDAAGVPNRIVAIAPGGGGREAARAAAAVVSERWEGLVRRVGVGGSGGQDCPGMPETLWVVVGPESGLGYEERWDAARVALDARKRSRLFVPYQRFERRVCALSPRWAAVQPPKRARRHDDDTLGVAGWVKRCHRDLEHLPGYPSTASHASAPFRRAVLDRWDAAEVREAVAGLRRVAEEVMAWRGMKEQPLSGLSTPPGDDTATWFAGQGGPWVYPESWEPAVLGRDLPGASVEDVKGWSARGRAAAGLVNRVMAGLGQAPATPYLAVVAQDLDGMGRLLCGQDPRVLGAGKVQATADWHRQCSQQLRGLGARQARTVDDDCLGSTIYAGGDDLLALLPVANALAAAGRVRVMVDDLSGFAATPTASTAVVFFHMRSPLQHAVRAVHDLLEVAKTARPGKDVLAVAARRRGGQRMACLQPWRPDAVDDRSAAALLEALQPAGQSAGGLSPRLASALERDREELCLLGRSGIRGEQTFAQEIARVVSRHGGTPGQARALAVLARHELGGGSAEDPRRRGHRPGDRSEGRTGASFDPVPAAVVARFLQQEGR